MTTAEMWQALRHADILLAQVEDAAVAPDSGLHPLHHMIYDARAAIAEGLERLPSAPASPVLTLMDVRAWCLRELEEARKWEQTVGTADVPYWLGKQAVLLALLERIKPVG